MATTNNWQPPILDLSVDRYAAYKSWISRWTDYKVVTKLDEQSVEYQCSMLRYTFSEETRRIYDTFALTEEQEKDPKVILDKLESFAKGTVNRTMERHIFYNRDQEEGELFDDFLTDVKYLTKNCSFCATCHDSMITDRIVEGVRDNQLRQKLLADDKLDLPKAEACCRAKEKAKQGVKLFNKSKEKPEEEINELTNQMRNQRFSKSSRGNYSGGRRSDEKPPFKPKQPNPPRSQHQPAAAIRKQPPCKFCVQHHQKGRQYCPAWGNNCAACGKLNHASRSVLCSKTKSGIRQVDRDDESEGEEEDEVGYLYLGSVDVGEFEAEEIVSGDEAEDESVSAVGYEAEDEYSEDESEDEVEDEEGEPEIHTVEESNETLESENQPNVIHTVETDMENEEEDEEMVREVRKKMKRKRRRKQYRLKQKARRKQVNEAGEDKDQDAVSWEVHMPAANGTIEFKLDTGADVTIMPETDLPKLDMDVNDVRPTRKRLYGANGQRIRCLGYVSTKFTWGEKTERTIIYVCKNIRRALLGKPTINKFNMIKLNIPQNYSCGNVDVDVLDDDTEQLEQKSVEEEFKSLAEQFPYLRKYKNLFTKLGCINAGDEVNIRVKDGTQPHQTYSPRHIPLPLLQKVTQELKRMEKLKVIRKIDKPTKWCHPIVIVSKPSGDIRLCIDLTKLNSGVERELYQLESVDETMGKLGDDCVFMSKLDANSGYWQVPLDEESQELTTFITPVGRFCCTRGPYGLSSMQEIFSKKMDIVIDGLEGVVKSTDDFLVYGKTVKQLEERTEKLLQRFEKYGVTVNVRKCLFERTEMDFLGHSITKDGIKPLQSKMDAVKNFPQPTNITELRRFMGMANQMAKFNPNLAEASAPLRLIIIKE